MPFPMKVQPFDPGSVSSPPLAAAATDNSLPVVVLKPLPPKSRLKRLLERQFRAVPAAVTAAVAAAPPRSSSPVVVPVRVPLPGDAKDNDNTEAGGAAAADPEPSSLCLSKMVHNFLEGNNDKPARCGRRRCSCFNGSTDDSSDDEFDSGGDQHPPPSEVSEIVKSLVSCTGVPEKTLLAEVCKIVERTRLRSDKVDDTSRRRKMVVDGLVALGYDASVCKSRWEKSASVPDGEYDYIDVVLLDGGSSGCVPETDRRVLIDIDFRSEFEIARSTKRYRAVLQSLPPVFVGRADRLQQIVAVVSEAARQSLKKRGLHVPPWRKSEYMKAKWLSPYQRLRSTTTPAAAAPAAESAVASTNLIHNADVYASKEEGDSVTGMGCCNNNTKKLGGNCDGVGNVVGALNTASTDGDRLPMTSSEPVGFVPVVVGKEEEEEDEKKPRFDLEVRVEEGMVEASASEWQPPAVTPKARTPKGARVVTGLTSMILAETGNVDG